MYVNGGQTPGEASRHLFDNGKDLVGGMVEGDAGTDRLHTGVDQYHTHISVKRVK
jgi:hypothetical protein